MRVCLMIEGQEGVTWDDWVRLARLAERQGLEGLFRSDHYTAIIRADADALDAWTTLAGLAAVTERIRLGTLVSPATFRHPSVLARMAVTVDHISGGRLDVGMGAGWYEREHLAHGFPFLDAKQRFELFAEQVEVVVRSWTEDSFDHSRSGSIELAEPDGAPTAGSRDRIHPTRPRRHGQAPFRGARGALRGRGQHARRAERRARGAQAATRPRVRRRRSRSRDARVLRDDRVLRRFRPRRRSSTASARSSRYAAETCDAEEMLEQRRASWLAGTVEEVAERIRELEAIGVTRVFLQHLNHSDDDMVGLVGERLLPAVA